MAVPTNQDQCKAMREKYWGELDDQGKIERLRQEVKHLKSQNRELMAGMEQLLKHTHDHSGKPVIPIEPHGYHGHLHGSGSGRGEGKDDVYI